MEVLIIGIVLLSLLLLDLASMRWGVISTERWDSPEWQRRRNWRGFVGHR